MQHGSGIYNLFEVLLANHEESTPATDTVVASTDPKYSSAEMDILTAKPLIEDGMRTDIDIVPSTDTAARSTIETGGLSIDVADATFVQVADVDGPDALVCPLPEVRAVWT